MGMSKVPVPVRILVPVQGVAGPVDPAVGIGPRVGDGVGKGVGLTLRLGLALGLGLALYGPSRASAIWP